MHPTLLDLIRVQHFCTIPYLLAQIVLYDAHTDYAEVAAVASKECGRKRPVRSYYCINWRYPFDAWPIY